MSALPQAQILSIDLIDELSLWIDAWDEPRSQVTNSEYWRIAALSNKGMAMIATKRIAAHTTIVMERPILYETKRNALPQHRRNLSTGQLLLQQFNELTADKQTIVNNLANVFADNEKENRIEGIYDTSACQTSTSSLHTSGLFPTFARLNHSCLPNCTMYFKPFPADCLIVKTLFDIEPDTELTVSYLPRFQLTYQERQNLLQQRYKFQCGCVLCKKGDAMDEHIKEYRLAVMNGDKHWNCIQTALNILDEHFRSFPAIKANLLSSAIDCATEQYMYEEAYQLIVDSIQLNLKCYGLRCLRWQELHGQILLLQKYSNDERCERLLQTYEYLWRNIE